MYVIKDCFRESVYVDNYGLVTVLLEFPVDSGP